MSAIRKLAAFGKEAAKKVTTSARGKDDDPRQMIADMIADDATPFTPDDMSGLSYLSASGLKAIYDQYAPDKDDGETVEANEENDDMTTNATKTTVDIEALVANAVKTAVDAAVVAMAAKFSLSDDDKAALASAREVAANKRAELVAHVLSATKISAKELETMSDETLRVIANGLPKPVANYAGRAMPTSDDGSDPAADAMSANAGVVHAIRNAKKG